MPNDDDNVIPLRKTIEVPSGRQITGHPRAVREYLHATEREAERARRWPKTADGLYVDTQAAMTTLVRSFPSLRFGDGVEPWNVERFMRWAAGGQATGGSKHAARFVLGVAGVTEPERSIFIDAGSFRGAVASVGCRSHREGRLLQR